MLSPLLQQYSDDTELRILYAKFLSRKGNALRDDSSRMREVQTPLPPNLPKKAIPHKLRSKFAGPPTGARAKGSPPRAAGTSGGEPAAGVSRAGVGCGASARSRCSALRAPPSRSAAPPASQFLRMLANSPAPPQDAASLRFQLPEPKVIAHVGRRRVACEYIRSPTWAYPAPNAPPSQPARRQTPHHGRRAQRLQPRACTCWPDWTGVFPAEAMCVHHDQHVAHQT